MNLLSYLSIFFSLVKVGQFWFSTQKINSLLYQSFLLFSCYSFNMSWRRSFGIKILRWDASKFVPGLGISLCFPGLQWCVHCFCFSSKISVCFFNVFYLLVEVIILFLFSLFLHSIFWLFWVFTVVHGLL